ncbi:MAG: peptidase [Acidobacteriaceae bacterium]|nr:peptidase [Acidobacteriaceae bacterium]
MKTGKVLTRAMSRIEEKKGEGVLRAALRLIESRQKEMLHDLQGLVEFESPSSDKAAVDLLGAHMARQFADMAGEVTVHSAAAFGDHLQVDFVGVAKSKPVLLLGHFDTVWEIGTLKTMPFKIEKGRAWGPGVYDMKLGIVMMMHAIRALREASGGVLPYPVRVWLVTDEEVGSDSSRKITEQLAMDSAAVFVLEPSQGIDGAVKTWRKGVGGYTVKVAGKASHSGVDFEKGENAILELAKQITKIAGFTDLKRGITVNPGVISGGTRVNVVAAEASVAVDVRIEKLKDAALMEKKFRGLKPFNKKCKLEIEGGINRPPMERSEKVLKLYRRASELAREIDKNFVLKEKGTGGGSDGNFTAALGIPTLDGLGAVGEGAHAVHESALLSEIPRRTALLAGLIGTCFE